MTSSVEVVAARAAIRMGTTAIQQAMRRLPDRKAREQADAHVRQAAYNRFSDAVWASYIAADKLRALTKVTRNWFKGGFLYLPMFWRVVDQLGEVNRRLLAAFEETRTVGSPLVTHAAHDLLEAVSGYVGDLDLAGPSEDARDRLGRAQRDFVAACRIDLKVDEDPARPRLRWWSPRSIWRWWRHKPGSIVNGSQSPDPLRSQPERSLPRGEAQGRQ